MPARNDPCPCGSGKKWKKCHGAIADASPQDKYSTSQQVYQQNWADSSRSHEASGLYDWMAERLRPHTPKRILDIGCGTGEGIASLYKAFGPDLVMLGIDENYRCIQVAKERLAKDGIDVATTARLGTHRTDAGYEHRPEPAILDRNRSCNLVEADVSDDREFWRSLAQWEPFDAVTVWLTGVHSEREKHIAVRRRGADTDGGHRLMVQNDAYVLADRLLRPGGALHIVDRGLEPSTDLLKQDILDGHRRQASVTSMIVGNLEYLPYSEPAGKMMPMGITLGTSGLRPPSMQTVINSIISTKPATS